MYDPTVKTCSDKVNCSWDLNNFLAADDSFGHTIISHQKHQYCC